MMCEKWFGLNTGLSLALTRFPATAKVQITTRKLYKYDNSRIIHFLMSGSQFEYCFSRGWIFRGLNEEVYSLKSSMLLKTGKSRKATSSQAALEFAQTKTQLCFRTSRTISSIVAAIVLVFPVPSTKPKREHLDYICLIRINANRCEWMQETHLVDHPKYMVFDHCCIRWYLKPPSFVPCSIFQPTFHL